MTLRKRSFPPAGATDPVLLILGSLPGEASLAAGRYYAHPRNQFWPLLGAALGEPLDALAYDARLAQLAARGVALWDVVAEAERRGSLDGAIRNAAHHPLEDAVARWPRLRAIAFNGKKSAAIGRRQLAATPLTLVDLPSSSPAFTLSFADKRERWMALADLALPAEIATLGA